MGNKLYMKLLIESRLATPTSPRIEHRLHLIIAPAVGVKVLTTSAICGKRLESIRSKNQKKVYDIVATLIRLILCEVLGLNRLI